MTTFFMVLVMLMGAVHAQTLYGAGYKGGIWQNADIFNPSVVTDVVTGEAELIAVRASDGAGLATTGEGDNTITAFGKRRN